jgi:hypothetical protein
MKEHSSEQPNHSADIELHRLRHTRVKYWTWRYQQIENLKRKIKVLS